MTLYEALRDLLLHRYPIRVRIAQTNVPGPNIAVTITNQTANAPVRIRAVRIHFGKKLMTRAIILMPCDEVALGPKEQVVWRLPFAHEEKGIFERSWSKKPVVGPLRGQTPSLENPAQLFHAIRNGLASQSWIEIAFNEYNDRVFLKGKVKELFELVNLEYHAMHKNDNDARMPTAHEPNRLK